MAKQHLPANKKFKMAMTVLRGKSYSETGRDFGIAESTVRGICNTYFRRCFLESELCTLPENERNLAGYRKLLSKTGY
jgi:DNA-directed RNA polymerase specialized sigma24 family protein